MHLKGMLWFALFTKLMLLSSITKLLAQELCSDGEIRLVGTGLPDIGRVEVCFDGSFGTICDNGWDDSDAALVCSLLGQPFTGAVGFTFGGGNESQLIHFEQVECLGDEVSLLSCDRSSNVSDLCTHRNDSGVACSAFTNNLPVLCADNLSCPGVSLPFQCLSEADLCDGSLNCLSNIDENDTSLLCSSREIQCNVLNERVPFAALCDGIADCSGGEDERTEFCANHCLSPYEGGCQQLNRQCVSLRSGPVCGECLGSFVDDPNNPGGECVRFAVRFIGNTPFVNMTTVFFQFTANEVIASVECLVGNVAVPCDTNDGNIGMAIIDLEPTTSCQVLINITAISVPLPVTSPAMISPFTDFQQSIQQSPAALNRNFDNIGCLFSLHFYFIPGIDGVCTAHVVNQAIATHGQLNLEYKLVTTFEMMEKPGTKFNFNCIKDDDSTKGQNCGPPITISDVGRYNCRFDQSPHTVRIQVVPPGDALCSMAEIQDHVFSFMIPD